jgi:hypothetical protein
MRVTIFLGKVGFAKGDGHGPLQTMGDAHKLRVVRRELTLQLDLASNREVEHYIQMTAIGENYSIWVTWE